MTLILYAQPFDITVEGFYFRSVEEYQLQSARIKDSMKDLAVRFVEDGLYGDIPKPLEFYIHYDAIARDLAADYSQTTIAGNNFIYRCG